MTPPAVADPPQYAAAKTSAPAAALPRVRVPFSHPRPPRPGLVSARAVAWSVIVHAVLGILVLLGWSSSPSAGRTGAPERTAQPAETVQYMDVSEWGALAEGGAASVPSDIPAPEVSAAAVDSILAGTRAPLPFPERVPSTLPAGAVRPGAGAGQGGAAAGAQGGAAPLPGARPGAPAAGTGANGAGQGTRTGRGVPGVEYGDPRLVVQPAAIPERELTREERYQRHFEDAINAINDSIAGAAERRRRQNDWTVTGANGKKTGLDDRGVIVNGVRIPTPHPGVGRVGRDREDEARRERSQRTEIDRQAEQTERERYLRERQRAIRERENERRRQAGQTPPQDAPKP
jgi:hypothetical protein